VDKRASIASLLAEIDTITPGGFAIGLHISFNGPVFLFQTFPQDWIDYYSGHGLHLIDPAVAWSFAQTGHIHWSELAANDTQGVMQKAREHGLTYGTTLSFSDGGTHSVCGISRQDRNYLDAEIAEIETHLGQLHRLTAGMEKLTDADIAALTRMSIRLSHS